MPGAAKGRGFSLIELVIVIFIIGTLLAVALNRLLPWLDEAERISVMTVESQIRSALVMEAARRIASGSFTTITELEGRNPFELMLVPPGNYAGAFTADEAQNAPPRHWFYDRTEGRLVYRIGLAYALGHKNAKKDDPKYEVRVAFADNNGTGVFEPQDDEIFGVRLHRISGDDWLSAGREH